MLRQIEVCVCVCEREREREYGILQQYLTLYNLANYFPTDTHIIAQSRHEGAAHCVCVCVCVSDMKRLSCMKTRAFEEQQ